jgi:hypothetical protein
VYASSEINIKEQQGGRGICMCVHGSWFPHLAPDAPPSVVPSHCLIDWLIRH